MGFFSLSIKNDVYEYFDVTFVVNQMLFPLKLIEDSLVFSLHFLVELLQNNL